MRGLRSRRLQATEKSLCCKLWPLAPPALLEVGYASRTTAFGLGS
jgi:hypothetical protein